MEAEPQDESEHISYCFVHTMTTYSEAVRKCTNNIRCVVQSLYIVVHKEYNA